MNEEEIELMRKIDEQIEKNNALKNEIKEIELKIQEHNMSIAEATATIKNVKKDI